MASSPVFVGTPLTWWLPQLTSVDTDTGYAGSTDGVDSSPAPSVLISTGSATRYVSRIRCTPLGTNSTAAVLRVWLNTDGGSPSTSNMVLIDEIALGTTTASNVAANTPVDRRLDIWLTSTQKLYVGLASSSNLTDGWSVLATGGEV